MLRASEQFSADYVIEAAEVSSAAYVFSDGVDGEARRAVFVSPFGDAPAWSARLSVARPLTRSACSGDYPTPRPDVVLFVERGVAFFVEARRPERYRVIGTDGPVLGVEPVVREGLLLLLSPWSITAIGGDGLCWSTPRIAIESLRVDEVAGGWLRGVADPRDEEPRDFAVELGTGRLVGGAGFS
jgi:hypothetical protein